jgi:hypothetical protein
MKYIFTAIVECIAAYAMILLSLLTGKPMRSDDSDLPRHLRNL